MKKYGRDVFVMLLIFAGLILWGYAVSRYEDMSESFGGISLRFETNPQKIETVGELRNQEKERGTDSRLTAWRQDYNLKIVDPSLGLCIESDVIYMWGDGKDLPATFGSSGCTMSEDKAYELWGSRDVLGKTVYINGVLYKVTGITDSMKGIIAVKRDDYEKDMKFVSLDINPKADGNESDGQIEEFVLQNSRNADSVINYSDLLSVAGNFLIFPSLVISILMFFRILSGLYSTVKHKNGCSLQLYYMVFLILWLCICIFAGSLSLKIPGSFIPTKWSDFEFWSGLIKRYEDNLKGLRLMRMYALDDYFKKSFICVLVWGLLSSACFMTALRNIRNKSLNNLMVLEVVSAFIMFCAATASSGIQYGRYSTVYWVILPTYFVFDFFINNFSPRETTYQGLSAEDYH